MAQHLGRGGEGDGHRLGRAVADVGLAVREDPIGSLQDRFLHDRAAHHQDTQRGQGLASVQASSSELLGDPRRREAARHALITHDLDELQRIECEGPAGIQPRKHRRHPGPYRALTDHQFPRS